MKKDLTEQLVEKYPKIFSRMKWFEHGDGWYNIIDSLCACIQNECNHEIKTLKRENPQATEEEIDDLQTRAVQVKEKFGGLRFYIGFGSPEIYGMIRMAEEISLRTCEDCGRPGKKRGGGWIRTLCDPCSIDPKTGDQQPDYEAEDEGG
jgi:hypothetical protein